MEDCIIISAIISVIVILCCLAPKKKKVPIPIIDDEQEDMLDNIAQAICMLIFIAVMFWPATVVLFMMLSFLMFGIYVWASC